LDAQFALMPVVIKTPALPLVVAPALPGTQGGWSKVEDGIWQLVDVPRPSAWFCLEWCAGITLRRASQTSDRLSLLLRISKNHCHLHKHIHA
jgi:hypothetical protein